MLSQPISPPSDEFLCPPAVPGGDLDGAAAAGEPTAETVRRAHLAEESYVKALEIVNYFYGLLFALPTLALIGLAVLHATGAVSAPWISRPSWLAMIVVLSAIAILATLAGYGFHRLRRWALGTEALVGLCGLIWYFLWFLIPAQPNLYQILMGTSFLLALAAPMLDLWDLRHSVLFDGDYRRIIAATPSLRATPRLPREHTRIAGLFLAIFIILLLISS
jgi:hypothetical protein